MDLMSERSIDVVISFRLTILSAPTPVPGTPKTASPPLSPHLAPQGPSQLLTALLVRLQDATNRALIDQAAIDFAFLNSKAARKRLVKVWFLMPTYDEAVLNMVDRP